jgi:hypothetical protein
LVEGQDFSRVKAGPVLKVLACAVPSPRIGTSYVEQSNASFLPRSDRGVCQGVDDGRGRNVGQPFMRFLQSGTCIMIIRQTLNFAAHFVAGIAFGALIVVAIGSLQQKAQGHPPAEPNERD